MLSCAPLSSPLPPPRLYSGRAKGRQFGTKCSSGDRIGCGIERVSFEVQTAQVFFTKNGKRVRAPPAPPEPRLRPLPGPPALFSLPATSPPRPPSPPLRPFPPSSLTPSAVPPPQVGCSAMPLSPEGLFPAVGLHSLGEEVRLHLRAALEDDSAMMVDSHEEEWGRLHDVRACGTVRARSRGGGPGPIGKRTQP